MCGVFLSNSQIQLIRRCPLLPIFYFLIDRSEEGSKGLVAWRVSLGAI